MVIFLVATSWLPRNSINVVIVTGATKGEFKCAKGGKIPQILQNFDQELLSTVQRLNATEILIGFFPAYNIFRDR